MCVRVFLLEMASVSLQGKKCSPFIYIRLIPYLSLNSLSPWCRVLNKAANVIHWFDWLVMGFNAPKPQKVIRRAVVEGSGLVWTVWASLACAEIQNTRVFLHFACTGKPALEVWNRTRRAWAQQRNAIAIQPPRLVQGDLLSQSAMFCASDDASTAMIYVLRQQRRFAANPT